MEVGMLFYDTNNKSIGETLFEDGNTMIGKYYKQNGSSLIHSGYGKVVDNHKIWGKKHIIDYLNKEIDFKEKELKVKGLTNEEITSRISDEVKKLTLKNHNSYVEINNILKHQEICYSKNRKKQISCILKNVRRNNKKIKSLVSIMDNKDKRIENIKIYIKSTNTLRDLVKSL